ncbi:cytidylate kinase-like family protein [Pseudoflavonifractor sp. AF19-9AC]|uniref:cytidylate kinase-like family protein n=1 Tax=Pseudoflavonifractor sp. AF19-9AC TaxID=2292244 RepID=UPI000E4E6575|nr:cytidylate kinase-like family protein [Pseudoflavonifractor sp. AF19-9AC]RHR10779.1 cytidylate kinase-like family protein [Pseudoflavonifractor sp. AF19-9AC]
MSEQLIITLGREFGSGGHEIARRLAERFSLPLLEENMLRHIAEEKGLNPERMERYDESPRTRVFYRTVNGFSNAPEDVIAEMQFQYLRDRAAAGDSFLVVGRCAEEVLKDYPGRISIFVLADQWFKKERTMARGAISEEEALELMVRRDKRRKHYHNQYCKGKWGDSRSYDLCINSSKLGIQGTVEQLELYIRARIRTNRLQEV